MSGLVSFHTLHALYCYLELFHRHIPPVISCDNNPISSRRSLKFHLIKFKQETGGEHSNKSHLFLSYKCCCNTCWKRSGLWTFRGQPRFSWSGLRCVSNDCPGEEEKKKKCIAEWIKHRQTAGFRWMFTATVSSCCLSSCPLVTTSGPTVISWPALKHWYCELKAIETFTWVCMCTCTLERLIKNMSTQRGCPLQNSADNKVAASHDNVKWNPAGHVYPSNLR